MINELKIQYFLTLAKYGSISRAAEELCITPQALSKQIHSLEQDLDCVLIIRRPRGIELTKSGAELEKVFRSVSGSLQSVRETIKRNLWNETHVINIGCASGMRPGAYFKHFLDGFSKAGEADFWLGQPESLQDLVNWLYEGRFDLILCTSDYPLPAEFSKLPLCRTPFYYFVSREHPLASASAKLLDFRQTPFYLTDNPDRTDWILSICGQMHFLPEKQFSTANPYSTYLMTEMGLGISFGSGFCNLHTSPEVRAYPIEGKTVTLNCVWNPEHLRALPAEFIRFLRTQADGSSLYDPHHTTI